MRIAILTLLLLASPAVAAPPCKECKVCDCGPACPCVSHAEVYARVEKWNETIVVAVGVPAEHKAVRTSLPGYAPGNYRLYRDRLGRVVSVPVTWAKVCYGTHCEMKWVETPSR